MALAAPFVPVARPGTKGPPFCPGLAFPVGKPGQRVSQPGQISIYVVVNGVIYLKRGLARVIYIALFYTLGVESILHSANLASKSTGPTPIRPPVPAQTRSAPTPRPHEEPASASRFVLASAALAAASGARRGARHWE